MRTVGNAVRSAAIVLLLGSPDLSAENESATKFPPVSPGIAQLAKLRDTGLTEEVLVAYVQNSSVPKPNADELIYLHERGVPPAVITALLKRNDTPPQTANVAQGPGPAVQEESIVTVDQQPVSQPIIVASEPTAAQSSTVIHIPARGYTPRYNESYFAPYFGAPYPGSFYNSPAYLSPIYSVGPGFNHFAHHQRQLGHHRGHHHHRQHGHHGHHRPGHRPRH